MSGCLLKPYTQEQFLTVVSEVLSCDRNHFVTHKQFDFEGDSAGIFKPDILEKSLTSNPGAIGNVVSIFTSSIADGIDELQLACENGCVADVRRMSHRLKGAASNVGGIRLHNVFRALEQAADKNDISSFCEIVTEAREEFCLLNNEMDKYLYGDSK